jgi:hypothetical protein
VRARYQQPPAAVCKQRVLTVGQLIIHIHEAQVGRYAASIGGARREKRSQGQESTGGADGQVATSHRSSILVNTLLFLLKLSKVPLGG